MRKYAVALVVAAFAAVPATASASSAIPPINPARMVITTNGCTNTAQAAFDKSLDEAREARRAAFESARRAYATAKTDALKARRDALAAATTDAERQAAGVAFHKAKKQAIQERQTAKKSALSDFRTARKAAVTAYNTAKADCRANTVGNGNGKGKGHNH